VYTPGPWKVQADLIYSPYNGVICQLSTIHTPKGRLQHIPLELGAADWDEAMANADLIETAPDLLAASIQALSVLDLVGADRTVQENLRTVIERAQGKERRKSRS
jgi:hypothetical protein